MGRQWAFLRRLQYIIGFALFFALMGYGVYKLFIYEAPTCFDGIHNGEERGVDCGGTCQRICSSDVKEPTVKWARSFKITKGFYNSVAYIVNSNLQFGTKELRYTFTLYDPTGATIVSRSGVTFLPPDSEYPIFEGRVATGDREVAKTVITLEPITEWQVFTTDREQFRVDDRALRDVDSRPRLDATLTNTSLTDSRDVEIVATIFDRAGTALTASETIVPLFEGRKQKNVVFTWPEPIAKTLRSCEVPSDVILAVDLSGSMNNDGGTPPEPITSSLRSASNFARLLTSGNQLGVVTFATDGKLARTLSQDTTAAGAFITGLVIDPKEETGSTNIGDAIRFATEEFGSARHNQNARKVLIVFTDGLATAPDPDPDAYALSQVAAAKAKDITVFTIGLGSEVNRDFLGMLATDGEKRFIAPSTKDLDAVYRTISSAICEEGPAVIDIVPRIIGGLNDGR